MSRYTVASAWSTDTQAPLWGLVIQSADLKDNQNGHIFREGAFRVFDVVTGKPAVKGKGGTVPFKGESAWFCFSPDSLKTFSTFLR